jgi:hypothetical protein
VPSDPGRGTSAISLDQEHPISRSTGSAERSPMRGDALMNQVLLKNNLKHVKLSLSDIKKALLKGTN